jgi:tRNA C32,U32 (ribose-2'-O)-methylase TrmJ
LNRKKSSDTKQKTETKTSKKRRLSGISNGKPSKKSKIQTMTSLRGSVFSSSKTKQKKMKKKKKKETLQSLIQAQIQRTQTQEKETFTLHDFLKEIQW